MIEGQRDLTSETPAASSPDSLLNVPATDVIHVAGRLLTMHYNNFFAVNRLTQHFLTQTMSVIDHTLAMYGRLVVATSPYLRSRIPEDQRAEEMEAAIRTLGVAPGHNPSYALAEKIKSEIGGIGSIATEGRRMLKAHEEREAALVVLDTIYGQHMPDLAIVSAETDGLREIRDACAKVLRADTAYRSSALEIMEWIEGHEPALRGEAATIIEGLRVNPLAIQGAHPVAGQLHF